MPQTSVSRSTCDPSAARVESWLPWCRDRDKPQDFGSNELSNSDEYRNLGMGRAITRRDFLNGVAVGVSAGYAALNESAPRTPSGVNEDSDSSHYPPLRSALRGNYP